MIVCHCRQVNDRDVRAAVARGASDLAELAADLRGAGTDCRGCRSTLSALLEIELASVAARLDDRRRLPVVVAA